MSIYGYCRISTKKQSMERQIRNIKKAYPDAIIIQETYTGTEVEGREEFVKMLKKLKPGDILVFDSVSRMSREAEEGLALYEHLYNKGINLVFLKEPMINTSVYMDKTSNKLQLTGEEEVDEILKGINKSMSVLARKQIKIAFEQSEKEVKDLQQRTKESLALAKMNGKQIGLKKGTKLETTKSKRAKEEIKKLSADFNGNLLDKYVIQITKLSRNTYYKYKRELKEEIYGKGNIQVVSLLQELDTNNTKEPSGSPEVLDNNSTKEVKEYEEEVGNKPKDNEEEPIIQATTDEKEEAKALIEALKQKFGIVD